MRTKEFITENLSHYASDVAFREYWKEKGVQNKVTVKDYIQLHEIRIDTANRKQGLGTDFMNDLCKFADMLQLPIRLTPAIDFGATSVARPINFYKRFGFVGNKGRNKDYTFSETMYRNPYNQTKETADPTLIWIRSVVQHNVCNSFYKYYHYLAKLI